MKSLFEEMGGTYRKEGDYYIPNLELPPMPDYQIGKYGRMRRSYLKEHRPILYTNLMIKGTLFEDFPGWSMSRFMIGKQFQGKGYGKRAVIAFFDYFKKMHGADKLFISVSLDNTVARKMYSDIGFKEIKEVEYTFLGKQFKEMQMVIDFA